MPSARLLARGPLLVALLLCSGCIVLVRNVKVQQVDPVATTVITPTKAHLRDGSVVLFASGVLIQNDSLMGAGERYDLKLAAVGTVRAIPLDSVLGLETYRRTTDAAASVLASIPATFVGAAATTVLLIALFGSCPTFYTEGPTGRQLEAEGFSYSIAPLFEMRDVDLLRGVPANGRYVVHVLNEALETHYLNHLELLAVRHPPQQRALPDSRGLPVLVSAATPATHARDAAGRDVTRALRAADKDWFSSQPARLARVSEATIEDAIELEFPAIPADSGALVLRLRNSLLSTVLLYDLMLADAGPLALDWMGQRLDQIGPATELAKWYVSRMGLRVEVADGKGWRSVGRLGDTGPIAWKDVAIPVPTSRGQRVRVRITFPTDGWRIDQITLAAMERPASVETLPADRVVLADASVDSSSRAALAIPDDRYLITRPGQRFSVEFAALDARPDLHVTYMIASQGYYSEWLRPDWVRRSPASDFKPGDAALLEAMRRWHARKRTFEKQFYSTAIPVSWP